MEHWLIIIGIVAGIISGLLGVGGGIVLTPFLHYILRMPWGEAVALSLLVIAIQAPIGVWRHARHGAVSWSLAIPLVLGGAAGVWLGDLALPHAPVPTLKLLFAALLMLAAWRLVGKQPTGHLPPWVAGVLGFVGGMISRLLGVGGGVVTVPGLALMGVAAHVAVASSLVPVFTNAALATGANLARGLAWQAGILLAVGAILGTVAGTHLAHRLPEARLRRVVAAALIIVALLVAGEALRNLL